MPCTMHNAQRTRDATFVASLASGLHNHDCVLCRVRCVRCGVLCV